jgi:hypothetical protein
MKKYIVFVENDKFFGNLSQQILSKNLIVAEYQNDVSIYSVKLAFEKYVNQQSKQDYKYLQLFYDYKNIESHGKISDFAENRKIIILYYKKIRFLSDEEKTKYEDGIKIKNSYYNIFFDIYYKKLNGNTGLVKCSENYTVGEMLYLISKNENYEMMNHKFFFAGLELKNYDVLIKNINIKKESTIHMALNINTQQQIPKGAEDLFCIFLEDNTNFGIYENVEIDNNLNIELNQIIL